MLAVVGRQSPFSQREIMLVLFSPSIFATCLWVSPRAFLYFLKGLGMDLAWCISLLKCTYAFRVPDGRTETRRGKLLRSANKRALCEEGGDKSKSATLEGGSSGCGGQARMFGRMPCGSPVPQTDRSASGSTELGRPGPAHGSYAAAAPFNFRKLFLKHAPTNSSANRALRSINRSYYDF